MGIEISSHPDFTFQSHISIFRVVMDDVVSNP